MTLGDFLKGAALDRSPWNCSTMPADWCLTLGHPDFAAAWRGVIDPAECEAVPAEAGGLVALWDQGIGAALPAIDPGALELGDIAVVTLASLEAGAIWTGERFAIRAPRGLHFINSGAVAVAKAWRP